MKLNRKEQFELYRQLYFSELERQDKINGRVPVLVAIILAIVGLHSYLIQKMLPLDIKAVEITALVLFLLSVAALVVATIYAVRSWHGLRYAHVPPASEMELDWEEWRAYCEDPLKPENEVRCLDAEIGKVVLEYFVRCGSENRSLNKKKAIRLHRAFNCVLVSVATGFTAFVIVTLNSGVVKP